MFRIIEPKDYGYYRARIDLFIGLMNLTQDLSLSYEERACSTFIIGEEEGGIVYGGAILHKQYVNSLPNQLKNSLSASVLNMEYVWVCTLALCLASTDGSSETKEKLNFSQAFYRCLLKKLNEFGKKKNLGFLCLTLNPLEHRRIKNKGVWSCVLEIDPKESLDGLFYGILPLSKQKYKKPVCLWEKQRQERQFEFPSKILSLPLSSPFKEKTLLEIFKQVQNLKMQVVFCLKQTLFLIKSSFTKYPPHLMRMEAKLKKIEKDNFS